VAASLAAHGMLLYLFYMSFNDALLMPSGGQVMIVALQDDMPRHDRSQSAGHGKPSVLPLNHAKPKSDVRRGNVAAKPHARHVQAGAVLKTESHAARLQQPAGSAAPVDGTHAAGHVEHRYASMHAVAGIRETESDIHQRLQRIRRHLEHFKYYPTSARRRGIEGQVEIAFDLDGRGVASGLQLLSRSGYRILDRAALETVRRASPFPARGGHYRFQLVFRQS